MATSTMREPRARVPGGGSHPITNTAGLRKLRAATTFASVDEFVSSFARFVDETSVVLSTPVPVEVGAERDFVLQLADGTAVLEGRGKVVETSGTDDGANGRHWMRLGLVELTPSSRNVHRALLAVHKLPLPPHPHTVPRSPQRTFIASSAGAHLATAIGPTTHIVRRGGDPTGRGPLAVRRRGDSTRRAGSHGGLGSGRRSRCGALGGGGVTAHAATCA